MSEKNRRRLQGVLLVLVVAVAFWPALDGEWLWDDGAEITRNAALRDFPGLISIWVAPDTPDYFPLKTTVQWLLWQAGGDNRVMYHVASIAFHLLGAFLVWRLFEKLGLRFAWFGALLFAVHPAVVESVAWISELKNTISLPPLLLAMIAYLDYDEHGRRRDYVVALLWFLAAILCKSSVVMLPVALLLYGWWKRGHLAARDWRASSAFFVVALVLGLVTIWFQHTRAIGGWEISAGDGPTRVARAGLAIAFYLWKSILPLGLGPIYPQWAVDSPSLLQFTPWPLLALGGFWLWQKRAGWGRHALLGLGWFVLNLAPVLGFVAMSFMRYSWVADHFIYVSLVGVVGLAAAGAGALSDRVTPRQRPLLWTVGALLVVALTWSSYVHAGYFRTQEALWSRALKINPRAWSAHNGLGIVRLDQGRAADAIHHFEQALRLEPRAQSARYNLGNALAQSDRLPEAIAAYEAVLQQEPAHADALLNLGNALARAGRIADALQHYERVIALDPGASDARLNIGQALAGAGRLAEAVPYLEQALQLNPPEAVRTVATNVLADTHNRLGLALARSGRLDEALVHFEAAVRARPDFAEGWANIGNVRLQTRRITEAIASYEQALRLNPQLQGARDNLDLARRAQRGGTP